MERYPYIGKPSSAVSVPQILLQPETAAFLARFSGGYSATYKASLNELIYKLKAAGILSLIQDMWLFCAPTQADSLRNFVSAARDATLTGAPTFMAGKGFSALTTSAYVSLPWSTSGMSTNSGVGAAGIWNAGTVWNNASKWAAGANGSNQLGDFKGLWTDPTKAQVAFVPAHSTLGQGQSRDSMIGAEAFVVGAAASQAVITPASTWGGATPSGVRASPLKWDNPEGVAVVTRLSAFFSAPTITAAQMKVALGYLNTFLGELGALE